MAASGTGNYFKTKGDPSKKAKKFVKKLDTGINVFAAFAIICFLVSTLNMLVFSKDERFKEFMNETIVRIEEYFEIPPAE